MIPDADVLGAYLQQARQRRLAARGAGMGHHLPDRVTTSPRARVATLGRFVRAWGSSPAASQPGRSLACQGPPLAARTTARMPALDTAGRVCHVSFMSAADLDVRQCLLQFVDAGIGDLGVAEVQVFELRQSPKMLQPRVADLGVGEVQLSELRQSPTERFACKIKSEYRRTRRELFSVLSRIQNIGDDLGENGRTPDWYRANHGTPGVAGQSRRPEFWCSPRSATPR